MICLGNQQRSFCRVSGREEILHVQVRSSGCEEIPHVKGQRNPSKMVSTGPAVRRYSTSKGKGEAPARWWWWGGLNSHLESNPIPARDSQRAQTNVVWTRTQGPTETETELCLSISCGGMGQQWSAAGRGALGVGMA